MTRTEATCRRAVASLLGIPLLVACAGSPQHEPGPDPALVDRVAEVLEGRYTNHAQWQAQDTDESGPVTLEIGRIPVADAGRVGLGMTQSRPGSRARTFLLELEPDPRPDRLTGRFRPETSGDRWCPLEVMVRNDGFLARTDAATCRFGGDSGHALVKEIAHDGTRLVIGDRILAADNQPMGADRILQFDRIHRFTGWAGVRESAEDWRIAAELDLASDGWVSEPTDGAGMALGIKLRLGAYRWREDAPVVLRLTATDAETGELLGQSWADADARSIGLALPALQVGLWREK